jgi:hypothetical protein
MWFTFRTAGSLTVFQKRQNTAALQNVADLSDAYFTVAFSSGALLRRVLRSLRSQIGG